MDGRYSRENIDKLSSDIQEKIESAEDQNVLEKQVNELFDKALDTISSQEDPVAFVDQLQFELLQSLDGNDLEAIDSREELTHLQYLSDLNDNFQRLKFFAICKKLKITKTGSAGNETLSNEIVNELFVNSISVNASTNYFTQNARLLKALSELRPQIQIFFHSEVNQQAPFVGLVDAYLNNGVSFRPGFFNNINHLQISKGDLGRVSQAWSFINPPINKTYEIVDGKKTESLEYNKMNNLMQYLNNSSSPGDLTITGDPPNIIFKIGETEINLDTPPASITFSYGEFTQEEFSLPNTLDQNMCDQIYELFATCRAQSKDPRVIIDKMGGGRMNQYTRYLSDRVNVAMSYDKETGKITATGPFYTPKFKFMLQTYRRDYLNARGARVVDSISFYAADISEHTNGSFGVSILQRSGVYSDNVYGGLATFSQLAHRGQYQPRYMMNVPFSTRPLKHVQREAFRKYAQDQLGYDPSRNSIKIDEPVMVRAASGTINIQRENEADMSLNIRNTQLYPSLNLSNVHLTEGDFNSETGIVKVGRFEFVKLDTFKSFMKNRTSVLNKTIHAGIISFIKGLDKDVATEEIRDDLLEEVAEALYSYLENINKLDGFSTIDVDETDFEALKAKFTALSLADIVTDPDTDDNIEVAAEDNEEVSSQAFDVARYERANLRVRVLQTTVNGYLIYTETSTGGTYELKSYDRNQTPPTKPVLMDDTTRKFVAPGALVLPKNNNRRVLVQSTSLPEGVEYNFGSRTLTLSHSTQESPLDLLREYMASLSTSKMMFPRDMTLKIQGRRGQFTSRVLELLTSQTFTKLPPMKVEITWPSKKLTLDNLKKISKMENILEIKWKIKGKALRGIKEDAVRTLNAGNTLPTKVSLSGISGSGSSQFKTLTLTRPPNAEETAVNTQEQAVPEVPSLQTTEQSPLDNLEIPEYIGPAATFREKGKRVEITNAGGLTSELITKVLEQNPKVLCVDRLTTRGVRVLRKYISNNSDKLSQLKNIQFHVKKELDSQSFLEYAFIADKFKGFKILSAAKSSYKSVTKALARRFKITRYTRLYRLVAYKELNNYSQKFFMGFTKNGWNYVGIFEVLRSINQVSGMDQDLAFELAGFRAYDQSRHSNGTFNRSEPSRLKDHEAFMARLFNDQSQNDFVRQYRKVPRLTTLYSKLGISRPTQDKTIFFDIGPGIAPAVPSRRAAVTTQEIAERFRGMQTIALDLPINVNIYFGNNTTGYKVTSQQRDQFESHTNLDLIGGDGVLSLKTQYENSDNMSRPYPDRERPSLDQKELVVLRSANAVDLYCDWPSNQNALQKIASDFKDQAVIYFYNKTIIYKAKGESTWHRFGEFSDRGHMHVGSVKAYDKRYPLSSQIPYTIDAIKVASVR